METTTRSYTTMQFGKKEGCLAGALWIFLAFSPLALAIEPPPGGWYPFEVTALGQDALFSDTGSGTQNTAVGFEALYSNSLGSQCTGVGDSALHDNTAGNDNTGIGYESLKSTTTGSGNTGVGAATLTYNTTGLDNTAVGKGVLSVSNGSGNTAVGWSALNFNTTGEWNTSVGTGASAFNISGTFNTALGYSALNKNTTGSYNIGIGNVAGAKLSSGSYNIEIGNQGTKNDDRTIRIGAPRSQRNTYIAGISGVTVASGAAVMIDDQGHLGTVTSSARYKEAVQPMDKSSEAILSLKPVNFRYKKELDPKSIPQFGLIAEEVAKVDPDLVLRDEGGKPYTVRYEAVNAMLLNEFLKEHERAEEQAKTVEEQANKVEAQSKEITELKSTLEQQSEQMKDFAARLKANGL